MNEVVIPNNVLVHCPKVKFNLARVTACASCEHFSGLLDRFPGGEMPFAQRFIVQCRHDPVKRELKELAE